LSALKDINLRLSSGVYGLIGPNGAGKTTLMNIIVGNLRADAGQVLYNGCETRALGSDFRKILGYMPQQQALYPDFTGERFLYYVSSLRGLKGRIATKKVAWVVEQVGLQEHVKKRIGTMSGGMKQRLLIAQAILADPEVIILDEPTAGLDPNQRIAIKNLVGKLAGNRIIIISTHIVPDVEFIANEFLIIRNGELLVQANRQALVASLENKVYEIEIPADKIEAVVKKHYVSNIIRDGDNVHMRIISDEPPTYPAKIQRPGLEDVCLQYFEERL
jgi:ABC-type multidrug transport system ATPase subunit